MSKIPFEPWDMEDGGIVLKCGHLLNMKPARMFYLAHGQRLAEALYYHYEWLIHGTTSVQIERWILKETSRFNRKPP